jgi:hypothetical protein
MHQGRAKIHLRAFTISKSFRGSTPGHPWREGRPPPALTPSTASPCAGALRAPGSADPDLVWVCGARALTIKKAKKFVNITSVAKFSSFHIGHNKGRLHQRQVRVNLVVKMGNSVS